MVKAPLFILIIALMSSAPTFAQQDEEQALPPVTADFSAMRQTKAGTVDTVIDGLTFLLKTGEIVRLSTLDIPGYVYPQPSDISVAAQKRLQRLLPNGTKVRLYQTPKPKLGRTNRLGQDLAHVVLVDDDIWVQGVLLSDGLARTAPTDRNNLMAAQMYAIENTARDLQKGLWAQDAAPMLDHTNAAEALGDYAVVTGTIVKAASVRNTLYLNFGENWREDFTIQVPAKLRKELIRAGIDPQGLNGTNVRVRGWVRDYNGPLIELGHISQLEILDKSSQ